MRGDCVFCKIARGEIVAHRVHEDELALAFMDVGQVNPEHVIVAVKPHLETIADLTPEQVGATFHTVNRIARAVSAAFKSEGLTILQPNGIAGGQTVPHFHLHVLPRHTNDGVHVTWHRKNPPPDELAKLAARIRKKRPVRSSIPREKEEAMRRCVIVVVVLVLVPSVSSAVEFTARTNLFLDNTAGPCAGASVAGPAATPVAVERVCGPFGGQVVLDAFASRGSLGAHASAIETSTQAVGGGATASFTETLVITSPEPVIPISLNLVLSGEAPVGVAPPDGLVQYAVRIDGSIAGHVFFEELGISASATGFTVSHFGNVNIIGVPIDPDATFDVIGVTPVVFVNTSSPVTLELSLGVGAFVANGSPGSSVSNDFGSTLGFPVGIAVFNVLDGVTVDAPELNLFNNRFIAPTDGVVSEPTTMALFAVGAPILLLAARGRRRSSM